MRVLIAEDDSTTRTVLAGMLKKCGDEVVETINGAAAWDALQQPDAPALAILDWIMPEMDGLEVVRRVRALQTNRPPHIIMLTIRGEKADIIAGLEAGADDYLSKPFDPGELRARIEVGRRLVKMQDSLASKVEELRQAIDQIKTLRGIVPICASCKKIRDDQGYWNQVEVYVRDHTEAESGEGIFGLDVHGNHTFVNPAAAQMLGYTVDELTGRHSHTTWHYKKADGSPYPEEECPIYAACKDGKAYHMTDEVFWRKDGTSFPVEYTSTPITEDGKISGAVVTFRDISERKHMEEELRALSLVDELTGLYNRRGFLTLAKQQTKIADRLGKDMLLIFADIDKMKLINDTSGHKEGDRALIDTANILRKSLRDSDVIARVGGDEFAVLAMAACSEHAEIIYGHLRDNIKSHNEKEGRPYKISLSVGFVCYVPGSSIEELLVQADQLMYEDKQKKQL